MNERLTLQDLVDLLAEKQGGTKKDSEAFLRELFAVITENIENNESVKIKDFGVFKLVKVNARRSVDVNTGESIEIPSHYKLSFIPDKSLKEAVNRPFAHFESVILEDGVVFEKDLEIDLNNSNIEDSDEEIEFDPFTANDNNQSKDSSDPDIEFNDEIKDFEGNSSDTNKVFVQVENELELDDVALSANGIFRTEDENVADSDEKSTVTDDVFIQGKGELEQDILISSTDIISDEDDDSEERVELDKEIAMSDDNQQADLTQDYNEQDQYTDKSTSTDSDRPNASDDENEPSLKNILMNSEDEEELDSESLESGGRGFNKKWTIIVVVVIAILAFIAGYFYYCCCNNRPVIGIDQEVKSNQEVVLYDSILQSDTTITDSISLQEIDTLSNQEQNKGSLADSGVEALPLGSSPNNEKTEPKVINAKKTKVRSGQTLRMMGLEYYGNKSFWVYIYEENKAKITNPNNVPIGTELVIPAADKYGIDAKNAESLRKAKDIERRIFKQLE